MNSHIHTRRWSTAALLAACLGTGQATAQVQAQQGGALDANLQVGSGGYNSPNELPDYRARNLLVTGNVGGGRAFRGNVGYRAEGAFQGTLGSDTLFNFQRDSIYSDPSLSGYNVQGLGDRVVVTRPTTAAPGYLVNTGGGLSTRATYNPGAGVLTFRQSGGGLVSVTGLVDPRRVSSTQSLGLLQTPQGMVSIDASPLTGVQYNPLDASVPALTGMQRPDTRTRSIPPVDPRDLPTDLSINEQQRIDATFRPGEPAGQTPEGESEDMLLPTSLGLQIQSALTLQAMGREDNNIPNAQAQAIRGQLFGKATQEKPAEAPKAPKSPYEQLIQDIIARTKTPEGEKPVAPEAQPEADKPNWRKILDAPEQTLIDAKKKSRDAALRVALGMVDQEGKIDYERELPTVDPKSELGQLLAELDYTLPRVDTFVGEDPNRINNLMTRAEQELKAGRYLVAEGIYRQVIRDTKGDPLARAGLIHCQMGGGMIRSVAYNLRGLFTEHPELIALRYDTQLLPSTERLRWLQGRLQKMITDQVQGPDAGLVLAYLGYQLEATPLVEFGLSVAQAEAPKDPLMPLLRRIWLEGEAAGK